MAYVFQVAIDCERPHHQADWWAEVLGWEVEDQDPDFIRTMIEQGHATDDDTVEHNGNLVWKDGAAIKHPDDPETGERRRILFQLVPEPKTVKNRVHLDVWVGPENVEAERVRLEAMGATFLYTGRQGPHSWATMTDPEGNEFCVA